jgi:predicted RNase H-like HicB family nuclease
MPSEKPKFGNPAELKTGRDRRVLVEFDDLPRVATDGKDDREAMEEAIDALGADLSSTPPRPKKIRSALAVLGKQMTVEVRDAA